MEFKELKKKSQTDLNKALKQAREKLRELRFKDANKQLKDVRSIRIERKIIAWVLTLLNKPGSKPAATSQDKGSRQAEQDKS